MGDVFIVANKQTKRTGQEGDDTDIHITDLAGQNIVYVRVLGKV